MCVCAIVRFIVNSRGIRGCFHLSVLIIGESDLVNCLCPGNRLSSTVKTCCMVSVVGLKYCSLELHSKDCRTTLTHGLSPSGRAHGKGPVLLNSCLRYSKLQAMFCP